MALERVRFHLMAQRAFTASMAEKVAQSILDIRGGGLDTFSLPLRLAGGGPEIFDGCSWVMPVSVGHAPALTGDFNDWLNDDPEDWMFGPLGYIAIADEIPGAPLTINTGEQNVKLIIWADYELPPGSPGSQWALALADQTRKPDALEVVEEEPPV